MSLWTGIAGIVIFFWDLFLEWIYIFFVSFTRLETLWIIIPIWLSWFFAEFFQEKYGTSFGNAISNGAVPFWVGIDWLRQITNQLIITKSKITVLIFSKYLTAVAALAYGLFIVVYGIKGKEFIRYIGRIREITYVLVVSTPFIYGLLTPTFNNILAMAIFFPLFYGVIELIDYLTPKPQIYDKDMAPAQQPEFNPIEVPESKDFSQFR